jgi:hypothetical protein
MNNLSYRSPAMGWLIAAAMLALAPMVLSRVPPLYDYPSHLARVDIIHDLLTTGRFASMYRLQLAVIPNLGIDGFVLPLLFLGVPVEIAGRIFVASVALALCFGVVTLHRTLFGRASVVPLAAFAFLYNETFMFGFLNYSAGIALSLFAFAHWLRFRERPFSVAIALTTAWTIGIFFVHLLGALLMFGLVLSCEATEAVLTRIRADAADRRIRSAALRNLMRRMVVLAVPLACLVLLYQLTPLSGVTPSESVSDAIASPLHDLPNRVRRLLHIVDGYWPRFDEALAVFLGFGVAAAALTRRLRVDLRMLPAIVGLMAAYAIAPSHWAGLGYIAERMPVPILMLTLASFDVILPVPRTKQMVAAGIMAVVGLRSVSAAIAWRDADRAYAPMLAAIEKLPEGVTIYGAVNFPGKDFLKELRLPWEHFCSLASIRRRMFSAEVWAIPSQNLIQYQPGYKLLADAVPWPNRVDGAAPPLPGHDMLAPELLSRADYLLAVHPEIYQRPLPPALETIARSGDAVLYRIRHEP